MASLQLVARRAAPATRLSRRAAARRAVWQPSPARGARGSDLRPLARVAAKADEGDAPLVEGASEGVALDSADAEEVLECVRSALGLPSGTTLAGSAALSAATPFCCVEGDGTYMGLHSRWRLQVRHDGAFHSETVTVGQGLHYQQGYDGASSGGAREAAARVAGVAAAEAPPFYAHVAADAAGGGLEAGGETEGGEAGVTSIGADFDADPDATPGAAWTVENGLASLIELDDREDALLSMWMRTGAWLLPHVRPRLRVSVEPVDRASASSDDDGPRMPEGVRAVVSAQLRGGKVVAKLLLGAAHLPLQLRMQMWGAHEVYEFSDWRAPSDGGCRFPARVAHHPASGGTDTYVATRAGASAVSNKLFAMPDVRACAGDTEYVDGAPRVVRGRRTPGGHVLVRALLDGRDCGEWLLDTGCSGLVVSKATADKLRMETFGKLSITSVGGSHQSQMRRCSTLQIGPVVQRAPLFLEIHDAIDVVDGAHGANAPAGIIGWDFFRRAAVELPAAGDAGAVDLQILPPNDPYLDTLPQRHAARLRLVGRVPHIEASVEAHGVSARTLFMLDSGARGTDLIFHSSSDAGGAMLRALGDRTSRMVVRGLTKAARVQARSGVLDRVELGGVSADEAMAVFLQNNDKAVETSVFSGGMICSGLLGRFRVLLNYAQGVAWFLPDGDAAEGDGDGDGEGAAPVAA